MSPSSESNFPADEEFPIGVAHELKLETVGTTRQYLKFTTPPEDPEGNYSLH